MRLILLLVILTFTNLLTAQTREDTLKNLSIQWMQALERKDSLALEKFLSKDYTLSSIGDSDYVDRSTWMKNAIGKDWGNTSYAFKGVKVQDSQAIVNSIMRFTVKPIPFTMKSETTDHWIFEDGQWKVRTRYLGGNSITNFITTAKGFLLAIGLVLIILLFRRYRRKKKANTNVHAYAKI